MNVLELEKPETAFMASDPENADRYEIVDGQYLELPPMSAKASLLAVEIEFHLNMYGRSHERGIAAPEVLIKLPLNRTRNRRPDAIFVSYARWGKNRPIPDSNAWEVLPEICVEVVSPTDLAEEIDEKVYEYLEAGVSQVWVVYPHGKRVQVYDSSRNVRILNRYDTLDCESILPGFKLPLSELFIRDTDVPPLNGEPS
jgi:Uma2 family endonuclease